MKHFFSLMCGGPVTMLIFLLLTGPAAWAQAPAWQSAMAVGNNTSVRSIVTDATGNVYLAGSFSGTTSLGSTTLTSAGSDDIFVAKWNPRSNSFMWAQRAGGTRSEGAIAVALSGSSIYVAGNFKSATLSFGSTTFTNPNSNNGYNDGFVAKLTDMGSTAAFTWAQQVSGSNEEYVTALAVNGPSVYVTGSFLGAVATFGSITLANTTTVGTAVGYDDGFVAKLTDAGSTASFTWAQRLGGNDYDYVYAIAVMGTSVYVTGNFSSLQFTLGNITLTNAFRYTGEVYVAKLVDAGASASFSWAQQGVGPGQDQASSITVNGPNVYIAGYFYGTTVRFGSTTALANSSTNGSSDVFVAKLTDTGTSGRFEWAMRAGSSDVDYALTMAVSGANVYIAGEFSGPTASFGPNTLTNLSSSGYSAVFVTELTDAGNSGSFGWAQQAGSSGINYTNSLALSGTTIYTAGFAVLPASFGSQVITGATYSGFLASLTDPTLLATAAAQSNLSFSLYPNPARAATTVALPASPGTALATLTLRDALGRAVRSEVVPLPPAGLRYEFDLTNLPAGLYALQVQAGAATATRRLVVE